MSVAAIILADRPDADGAVPALYAFEDERTLIEWQVDQVIAAGVRDVEVVLGADADRIIPLVARDNVEPIVNPVWQSRESGMRVGASAVPRGTATALIVFIDQPRPARLCSAVLGAHREGAASIARASYAGVPGSPLVVSDAVLQALRNVRHDDGVEGALAHFETMLVPCDSEAAVMRISRAVELDVVRGRYAL